MKQPDLLLLDFDGVFYKFTDEFELHCDHAAARAAMQLGFPLSFQEALALAQKSYQTHGSAFGLFFERYNMDQEQYHHMYHDALQHEFIESAQISPDDLRRCGSKLAVLSHANRGWISQMMMRFGFDKVIPAENVFPLEDVGFKYKSHSEAPYLHVLEKMKASAANTIMVEDTAANLKPAKSIGIITIWLSHGRELNPQHAPYIDRVMTGLPDLLSEFRSVYF